MSFIPIVAMAASSNVNVGATFEGAVTVNNEVDINFGSVVFASPPSALADAVTMLPNGQIFYGGVFTGSGTGTPGSVDISGGIDGAAIDVFCDSTATMAHASGSTVNFANVFVNQENESGIRVCFGIEGAAPPAFSTTIDLVTWDTLRFGAWFSGTDFSGSFSGGVYSTANTGGSNIQVDVVYQ